MDFDDIIKVLVPKSTRKKLKKELKKKGLGTILIELFRALFGGEKSRPAARTVTNRGGTAVPIPKSSGKPGPFADELRQAHTYQANIAAMAQSATPDTMERIRLEQLNGRVADWVHMIEEIVAHAQNQQEDRLLAEERQRVPAAIERLEKQLAAADDPVLQQKLERTLANRRRQMEQLEVAARNRQLAALKVENTLAQLGIIYSQLRSGSFMSQSNSYERLSAEINEEVLALGDYLEALDELSSPAAYTVD
ncbi:MAG: hypothetical protein CL608_29335 [Anaerolineaceae bacterium]|nr:hypothetical protein [Anaerolineaceae bacterium]